MPIKTYGLCHFFINAVVFIRTSVGASDQKLTSVDEQQSQQAEGERGGVRAPPGAGGRSRPRHWPRPPGAGPRTPTVFRTLPGLRARSFLVLRRRAVETFLERGTAPFSDSNANFVTAEHRQLQNVRE
ncbi:hypothetical protein EVAR_81435_1 [Eumeta japonica]|uniref:Secreted protein n=1 Tax=Eumeta variegata TaxID=151549 RepID=A0A4C1W1R9_EUMVA|nr:hypothetical protein EVAR_81435_1 [Eumeta japonica]